MPAGMALFGEIDMEWSLIVARDISVRYDGSKTVRHCIVLCQMRFAFEAKALEVFAGNWHRHPSGICRILSIAANS